VHPTVTNNIIKFSIILEDKTTSWLRPSLKTEAYVVTDFRKDALKLYNGSFYKGGTSQAVYVVAGDRAVKTAVKIGKSNFDEIEILSGLKEGDQVITSDMTAYEHRDIINIK
jgi:HlyD family secretion protein